MRKRAERTEITQDMVLNELAKLAFAKDGGASGGISFKVADKIRALKLLGKHLGMFKDKVELSGEVNNAKRL